MNCTYTAQGYLLCPTDMNKKTFPTAHYSTVGFIDDAKAGVFIEPFEQQTSTAADYFTVKQTNVTPPAWVTDPKGQFSSVCTGCTIDSSSCQGGQENKCNLICKCSSCVNGSTINKPVIQSIATKGGAPQFYCGGDQYSSVQCTQQQLDSLKCTNIPKGKSTFKQRKVADLAAEY